VSCFKVLSLAELPSKHVGIGSWGVPKLQRFCNYFGKDLKIDGKEFCALINVDATN